MANWEGVGPQNIKQYRKKQTKSFVASLNRFLCSKDYANMNLIRQKLYGIPITLASDASGKLSYAMQTNISNELARFALYSEIYSEYIVFSLTAEITPICGSTTKSVVYFYWSTFAVATPLAYDSVPSIPFQCCSLTTRRMKHTYHSMGEVVWRRVNGIADNKYTYLIAQGLNLPISTDLFTVRFIFDCAFRILQ
jgi:hypothetical protein